MNHRLSPHRQAAGRWAPFKPRSQNVRIFRNNTQTLEERQALEQLINDLESQNAREQASFGIFHGHGSEESFITANKQGLRQFALELLKGSLKTDEVLNGSGDKIIPIDSEEDWIINDSQTVIQYIRPIANKYSPKSSSEYKETFLGKFVPVGCVIGAIILLASLLVGIWTIFKWVF